MNAHHQRASMLLNHDRHEEALHELQQAITEEPDNSYHHALQAIALSRLNRHQLALEAARKSVQLAPDLDYSHYVLAVVFFDRGQFKEARDAIKTAIQLEPEDADNFAQLARAEYALDHWQAALDAADQGLRLDASNDVCRHWRSQALQQLGRSDEAAKELDTLMAENPEDAHTHDARGWFLLQQGKAAEARGHFLEALRLQPDLESARAGFANALKSRHVVFSWILRFLIWSDRFRVWTIYAVAAAVFLSLRLGDRWSETHPEHLVSMAALKFLVWTLIVLMVVAHPLFNLLLRLDAEGRRALSPDQIRASNWNGLCLLAALLIMVLWVKGGGRLLTTLAFCTISLTWAINNTFAASDDWVRRRMRWLTILAAVLIPIAWLLPIVMILALVKWRLVLPELLRGAFFLPVVSLIISCFSDNILAYLERRKPDRL